MTEQKAICPHGDPGCPCPDGLWCHYEDDPGDKDWPATKAMEPPTEEGERMGKFAIESIKGENYKGRQWGWKIMRGDLPYLRVTTGGTGDCWNIEVIDHHPVDEDDREEIHVCELDDLIEALTMLRDSDAHKANVERWSGE